MLISFDSRRSFLTCCWLYRPVITNVPSQKRVVLAVSQRNVGSGRWSVTCKSWGEKIENHPSLIGHFDDSGVTKMHFASTFDRVAADCYLSEVRFSTGLTSFWLENSGNRLHEGGDLNYRWAAAPSRIFSRNLMIIFATGFGIRFHLKSSVFYKMRRSTRCHENHVFKSCLFSRSFFLIPNSWSVPVSNLRRQKFDRSKRPKIYSPKKHFLLRGKRKIFLF